MAREGAPPRKLAMLDYWSMDRESQPQKVGEFLLQATPPSRIFGIF
jgi:hypothetical protein